MHFLRSLLFAVIFYLGSIPTVLAAGAGVFISDAAMIAGCRRWALWFMWCVRWILGIRVEIRGELPQHAGIVACKHQSAFETIATLALFDRPAVVLKAELISIPVWGFIARRHGTIPVAREASGTAMRQMMRAAEKATAADRPIVIFPEGTRTAYGEAPALKPGVAGIYRMLKLPVTPVALDSGKLWPRRSFIKRPGVITLKVCAPIAPGLPREEFEAQLHAAINQDPTL